MILETSGVEKAKLKAGELLWNPLTGEARLRGMPLKLPRRAETCLGLLMEARGEIVPKEELQERIWSGALREDSSLAQTVVALRKALDPAPGGGSYIYTVARHGYRMALPVSEIQRETVPTNQFSPPRVPWRWLAASILLIAILLSGSAAWWWQVQRRQQAEVKVMEAFSILRLGRRAEGGRARLMIDSALQLAPNLPLANAALAEITARYGKAPFRPATDLARRAIADDPDCRECSAVLGYILMTREWAWEEAGHHLSQAVSHEPVQLQWRLWYAQWLSIAGSLMDAEREARAAIKMDPSRPHAHSLLASILFFQGRLDEAREVAVASTTLDAQHVPGHQWLERIYIALDRDPEALKHRLSGLLAWDSADHDHARAFHPRLLDLYARSGRPAVVAALLDEVNAPPAIDVNRCHRAVWKASVGDDDGALEELVAGAESKPFNMIYTPRDPAFVRIRKHPRFVEVVSKIGLLGSLPKA